MSTLTNAKPSTKLFIECVDEPAELIPVSGGVVIALCHRCPGRIDPNDDSAAVIQTSTGATVLVVADGMGGGPLGHKASAIAVELIAENVLASTGDDLRPAILDGIEAANEAILDLEVGAATTVAVVEIQQGRARGYHVGDSQSVIFGGRGAVKWKSTPHSPVGYAIESGMLAESDAMHHEDALCFQYGRIANHAHRDRPGVRIIAPRHSGRGQRRPVRQCEFGRRGSARSSRQTHGSGLILLLSPSPHDISR